MLLDAGASQTENRKIGDVVVEEFSENHCREVFTLRNASGSTITLTDPVGTPCKTASGKKVPVLAADIANVDSLLLATENFEETATATDIAAAQPFLVRGPATVRRGKLPTTDVVGDAINLDNLATALAAQGIIVVAEEATFESGTP